MYKIALFEKTQSRKKENFRSIGMKWLRFKVKAKRRARVCLTFLSQLGSHDT